MKKLGSLLFTASWDGTVNIYDLEIGTLRKCLKGHKGPVNCIDVTEDVVYSGSGDCKAISWNITVRNVNLNGLSNCYVDWRSNLYVHRA
jgi:WD40 repeat protein